MLCVAVGGHRRSAGRLAALTPWGEFCPTSGEHVEWLRGLLDQRDAGHRETVAQTVIELARLGDGP